MRSKRIYITIPKSLTEKVEKYNKDNPGAPISYSGACRKALEEILKN